jgi:hypothetical protein
VRRSRPGGLRRSFCSSATPALARDFSGQGIGPAVPAPPAEAGDDPGRYADRVADTFGRPSSVLGALRGLLPARAVGAVARLACVQPWARRRFVLEGAFGMG